MPAQVGGVITSLFSYFFDEICGRIHDDTIYDVTLPSKITFVLVIEPKFYRTPCNTLPEWLGEIIGQGFSFI
jgi:hypothetical protein